MKTSSLEEISDSRLLIPSGMFFKMIGGWLDLMLTYCNTLFGFMYGMCFPVFRSRVTSRKLTTFWLASIVIRRSFSWNVLQMSFFIFSICLGVPLTMPNPSSLYKPKDDPCFACNSESMKHTTNSHDSAPSKLPIVTSKPLLLPFFLQGSFPLNTTVRFA